VFVATASDRTVRAYDRDSGKVVWSKELPTGSEGVPATYAVNGRQFIVFPVAAGQGSFPPRFGGPAPARGGGAGAAAPGRGAGAAAAAAAAGGAPEAAAAAPPPAQGRGGRGAGGPQPAGAYIAYALPAK